MPGVFVVKKSQSDITPDAPYLVPSELIHALERLRTPIVMSHVVPDADALGSMAALARAWKSDRCRPKVALPEGSVSPRLAFLPEWGSVSVASETDFGRADGFIVVDTAKKDRCNVGPNLKETDWSAGKPVFCIDHHESNTRFGDINWVVDRAGSSAELVYHLLVGAGKPIDRPTASLLYAGIMSDTLGFSLPTTNASALRAAADLVTRGADVGDLGERLFRSHRQSEFDLLRIIYSHTRVEARGAIAYSYASFDDIHGTGCTATDIDDQITVPRSLDGVRLAMLFTEGKKGRTRINFRSSGSVTVSDLAAEFDGGGHAQAAGAILDCGLKKAIERVVPVAVAYLEKFSSDSRGKGKA